MAPALLCFPAGQTLRPYAPGGYHSSRITCDYEFNTQHRHHPIDTLRADHLGRNGYGKATSPAIDALAVILLLDLLGELQQVSQGVPDISPFTHIPKALVSQVSAAPLVWLLAVTVALTAVGLAGFRRREVG